MAKEEIWNVFLPVNQLSDSSAILTGHVDETKLSVYITGTSSKFRNSEMNSTIGEFIVSNTNARSRTVKPTLGGAVWLRVYGTSKYVQECRLYRSGVSEAIRCVTILFSPEDLLSSLVFDEENRKSLTTKSAQSRLVCNLLCEYNRQSTTSERERTKLKELLKGFLENAFHWCLLIMIMIFTAVEYFLSIASFRWCWSRVCVQTPSVMSHITFKLNRFRSVQSHLASQDKPKRMLFDTCGQQLFDSLLGVVFMVIVMYSGCADAASASVMDWADDTASNLNDLLHWLMGAPAGLKLNAQLTEYMGHFFLYHVYLWTGYLSLLRPALGWVIWIAACFGMLGWSTQMCLVQDIISMLTLHIYCFYVYAARLYSLQMYALSSLWRLFRGKKWNVLRLRVDSAHYTIDQLCVGTLLFTVLLFLLPTLLLYYCVFTTLRLMVLSFNGILKLVTDTINMVPAASVLLHILRSKSVAGDVLFTVQNEKIVEEEDDRCVVLSMQTIQLPIQKLYHHAQAHLKINQNQQEHQNYSWMELLKRVISGHLVYPWVNPVEAGSKEKLS